MHAFSKVEKTCRKSPNVWYFVIWNIKWLENCWTFSTKCSNTLTTRMASYFCLLSFDEKNPTRLNICQECSCESIAEWTTTDGHKPSQEPLCCAAERKTAMRPLAHFQYEYFVHQIEFNLNIGTTANARYKNSRFCFANTEDQDMQPAQQWKLRSLYIHSTTLE